MKVEINRYDPESEKKWIDHYEVPLNDKTKTIMDVLDYISLNLDPTLAYYQHSVCNHGICGRCTLTVNGKPRLACIELANNYEELVIGPIGNRNLIRDLITRR